MSPSPPCVTHYFACSYVGAVGFTSVADGTFPVFSYVDAVCCLDHTTVTPCGSCVSYAFVSTATLVAFLLFVVVVGYRVMKRSGPPPLYMMDFGPAMKVVCLFLVSELILRTRVPITATGVFEPTYVLLRCDVTPPG